MHNANANANLISTQNKDVQRQQSIRRRTDKVNRRKIPYNRKDKVENEIPFDKPMPKNEIHRKINRRKSPIPFKERINKHRNNDQTPEPSNIRKDKYEDKSNKIKIKRKDDFDGLDLSFWEDETLSTTGKPDYRHRWQNLSREYNDSSNDVASDRLDVTESITSNLEAISPVFSDLGDTLWDEINKDWNNDERFSDLSARLR